MKTVKEIIQYIIDNDNVVSHKLCGNIKLCSSDCIRVYKGNPGFVEELLYFCSWDKIDKIPKEILKTEIDLTTTLFIGGSLSVECVVITK